MEPYYKARLEASLDEVREQLRCDRDRLAAVGGDAVVAERMRADRAEAQLAEARGECERLNDALVCRVLSLEPGDTDELTRLRAIEEAAKGWENFAMAKCVGGERMVWQQIKQACATILRGAGPGKEGG